MTPDEARALGAPDDAAPHFGSLTAEEGCTQRCYACDAVIKKHADLRWRFEEMPQCRCDACAQAKMAAGEKSRFRAYCVPD